jgi:hypothetical protein
MGVAAAPHPRERLAGAGCRTLQDMGEGPQEAARQPATVVTKRQIHIYRMWY